MKKIIFTVALHISASIFAQDKPADTTNEKSRNLSINYNQSDEIAIGLSYEAGMMSEKNSLIANINYMETTVSAGDLSYKGTGFGIELGMRYYIFKNSFYDKLYHETLLLSYSRLKFSDPNYSGVYEYISPINSNFGYKFKLGKKFTIDPSVGFKWKVEIMSRGDVDNRTFDNFVFKAGVKLGYTF